jgi:hypothetical protein
MRIPGRELALAAQTRLERELRARGPSCGAVSAKRSTCQQAGRTLRRPCRDRPQEHDAAADCDRNPARVADDDSLAEAKGGHLQTNSRLRRTRSNLSQAQALHRTGSISRGASRLHSRVFSGGPPNSNTCASSLLFSSARLAPDLRGMPVFRNGICHPVLGSEAVQSCSIQNN